MCALRNLNSTEPSILAQKYRLNITQRRSKPAIVKRRRSEADVPRIKIEVADTNSNVRFSPSRLWRESSRILDNDSDFYDYEDDGYFSELATPVSNGERVQEYVVRDYRRACKKFELLPITCIEKGLVKQTLSCKFLHLKDNDCRSICFALSNNRFVERLDFQQNAMGPGPADFFAEIIENSPFLTHIKIADNDLRSEGARVICNSVIENKRIVLLDLSGNSLVESDGEVFQRLIKESSSLTELYLGRNNLMEKGVRQISEALKSNRTLEVLDLSWNHIRLKGAVAIGEALEKNSSLEKVNLAWNGLHKDGAKSIGKALEKNRSLIEIDLTCNRLSEKCLAEILKGLDSNSTLEILRIGQNHVTTRGSTTILQHIKENKESALRLLDLGNLEVHDNFEELYYEILSERNFKVLYGAVWRTDSTSVFSNTVTDDEIALFSCNPLTVLMECMRLQNMRLLDFFKSLDTDKSNMISIDELCDGMLKLGIPICEHTLLRLLQRLDVDHNHQLDYSEMLEAQNMHRQNLRRIFAANSGIEFEKTEIGKISAILRRIMSKSRLMIKADHHSLKRSAKKSPGLLSRSRTPSPFQTEEGETSTTTVDPKKTERTSTCKYSKTS